MSETRKTVTLVLTATFEGDYYDVDQVTERLQAWIDSGLNDRDDLKSWDFSPATVTETDLGDDVPAS